MNEKLSLKMDSLGALASFLCLIHCLATPFIFIAKTCSVTCCENSPVWWRSIDYIFLIISLSAVYHAGKNTSKKWVANLLWATWIILLITIFNESLGIIEIPKNIVFLPAFFLIGLHLYNQKYCRCVGKSCCANS